MIPYLLAAVGGYLIGQSRKQDVFADGGMIFKKGERVLLKDGGGQRIATIVQDGYDSKNRVRVRPEGFPMDLSIPMEEKYSDDKRLYIIRKMADGGEIRTLWLIKDNDAEMLMKGTPRSIKTFLNKEKKKSYRGEKSVYGDGLEEWYENTTKEEVLNHNRNYRSTDQSYADGGMMAKGGIFEVGDMVKVDDNGYVKLFSGFDISQPAKIISKEKGKAFGKVRYFYGLETADGKKPFNKAQESMLTKSAEKGGGMMAKGGEIADIDKMKKSLIQKAKSKGIYENFGQKEVRQLEDKYGYTPAVQKFDEWAMNFDLSQMADGGVLAHGLREDDKIYVERGNLAGIKNDKTDEKFIVDISTGSREKLKD